MSGDAIIPARLMDPERWQQMERVYHEALEKPRGERAAFLAEACSGDEDLRRQVNSLLEQSAAGILDEPALALDERTELNPATQLGPYRIMGPLGAGGMGKVYKAHDSRLNRVVAIKVSVQRYSDRFEKEARAVAALNHPHICTLYDIGPDYLVMEYIEGQTLRQRLGAGALPIEGVLEYGAQIADALAEAHAHGVVHRDLKPANIILTKNGVKVLDFGLARIIPAGDITSTMTRGIEGTPAYMAPEQAAGEMAGPSADLFSLGLVLYEMTTGRLPAPGISLGATLASGSKLTIPPLSRTRKGLPAGLEPLLASLLEADPACRPKSAREVKTKLLGLKKGAQARVRRWALAGALAAGLAVAALAFFRPASPAKVIPSRASIAVLPFVNKTGDPNLEYVVDGATSDLIRRLSMVPELRVISTASVMALKGKDLTTTAAAQRLGVDNILSGSIQGTGKEATLDVEVSRGKDGSVFLARHYAPREPDPIRFLSTVAQDLAAGMRIRLDQSVRDSLNKPLTANAAALDSYLKAGPLISGDNPAELGAAVKLLSDAVQKDPRFAAAISELAEVHIYLGLYYDDPRLHMPEAKALASKALGIDDSLQQPHVALGLVALVYDWDYDEARRQLILSSGRMQPSAIEHLACSTHLLSMSGRWNHDAEEEIHSALESNPISAMLTSELGCAAYYARRYDRALLGYTRALTLQPASVSAVWGLGKTYGQMGKLQEALDALDRSPTPGGMPPPIILGEQGYVYGRLNNRQQAERILGRLSEMSAKTFVDPFFRAEIYLGMGERANCIHALKDALTVRSSIVVSILTDPKWDSLQNDPGFREVARTIGNN